MEAHHLVLQEAVKTMEDPGGEGSNNNLSSNLVSPLQAYHPINYQSHKSPTFLLDPAKR